MPKLYEILLNKFRKNSKEEKQVDQVYNPINAKINGSVKLDILDYRNYIFILKEIRELKVRLSKNEHKFVDYELLARPFEGDDVSVRLRLAPNGETFDGLLLKPYDQFEYNQDFVDNVLKSESKDFIIESDGEKIQYWRVQDVQMSYNADVVSMTDFDKDKNNEVKKSRVEFWDFSRITNQEGVDIEEYMIVEMDKETGFFQLWQGTHVSPEQIEIF